MANTIEKVGWTIDGQAFEGHAVWQSGGAGKRPLVLICHAWAGLGEHEQARAAELAELGYVGFAVDLYGKGKRGTSTAECQALMMPLVEDPALLEQRLYAALAAARALPVADAGRTAAIGFCFGGLCALLYARSGADLRGVVSFHGLLKPRPPSAKITAKVLALHGYDDPMVKPDEVVGFCDEMTKAGADWQLHAYGGTVHAFTNKAANDPGFGTVYSPRADARSRAAMESFLREVFA